MTKKNIVILSDGTGKEGGKSPNTNVYRLFNMLRQRTEDQLVFYDPGIGPKRRQYFSQATGYGFSKNLLQCYNFLHEHYRSGDDIYLVGFSRGAATVRSLSGFIEAFGILPQSRPELIKEAYKLYKKSPDEHGKRKAAIKEFQQQHSQIWARVRAIGVWDTVASLGAKTKLGLAVSHIVPGLQPGFHNLDLSETVDYGFHALSVDDERSQFHPEIWEEDPRVTQVWFPGVHTDVGGGYEDQALADISLKWMIDQLEPLGLLLHRDGRPALQPDPDGKMHNERNKWYKRLLFRKNVRQWPSGRSDEPVVHPAVVARKMNQQNEAEPEYHPWIKQRPYTVYGSDGDGG